MIQPFPIHSDRRAARLCACDGPGKGAGMAAEVMTVSAPHLKVTAGAHVARAAETEA